MATLEGKIIRIACNQSSSDPVVDVLTELTPVIWRGAAARIQCALFTDDPASETYVTDVSNITAVELLVRIGNSRGTTLLDRLVLAAGITASTYAAWVDRTGQQFEFVLAPVDTGWDVKSDGQLVLYFSISVLTLTSIYVAARGYPVLQDVGIVDIIAPVLPSGFISLTPSAAGNTSITLLRGTAVVRIVAAVGVGPYTYIVFLPITNILAGSLVDIDIDLPASHNPTIEIRNTLGGTLLYSITGDSDNARSSHVGFRYTGTTWVLFGPAVT